MPFFVLLDETGFLTLDSFPRESRGEDFLREESLGDLDRFLILTGGERSRDFDFVDRFFGERFLERSGERS